MNKRPGKDDDHGRLSKAHSVVSLTRSIEDNRDRELRRLAREQSSAYTYLVLWGLIVGAAAMAVPAFTIGMAIGWIAFHKG